MTTENTTPRDGESVGASYSYLQTAELTGDCVVEAVRDYAEGGVWLHVRSDEMSITASLSPSAARDLAEELVEAAGDEE
ncbi:hypothetical protein J2754_003293 [Halarchaeum solikamskense]|uniref:hypothetical protein n=1 Tax=Halarchaeum nitratireducens TaxID=489913 RepID=UPI001B3AF7D6|nr:hypothetical protein [Halarchaeum solikamskense]MBP2252930.1 hypothetical protein [Halarchaeum solikamskense]